MFVVEFTLVTDRSNRTASELEECQDHTFLGESVLLPIGKNGRGIYRDRQHSTYPGMSLLEMSCPCRARDLFVSIPSSKCNYKCCALVYCIGSFEHFSVQLADI